MPLIFIKEYVNYEYTTGKEQCVNGIKGLELRKRQIERVEGEISIRSEERRVGKECGS